MVRLKHATELLMRGMPQPARLTTKGFLVFVMDEIKNNYGVTI